MMDLDRYETTAAWLQYCDGLTRFAAETEAARRQGYKRHEVQDAIRNGNIEQARDNGSPLDGRPSAGDVSAMQRHAAQEARRVSEPDQDDGSDTSALLALRMVNGGVVQ